MPSSQVAAAEAEAWSKGKGLVMLLRTLAERYPALVGAKAPVHRDTQTPLTPADLSVRSVSLAYKRATKVLLDNRDVLEELSQMLVDQETVDAEELQELLIRRDVRVADYV